MKSKFLRVIKIFLICVLVVLMSDSMYVNASDTFSVVSSADILHEHIGNSSTSGGCYTVPVACGATANVASTTSKVCGAPLYQLAEETSWRCTNGHSGITNFNTDTFECPATLVVTKYTCPICGTVYSSICTCSKITSYSAGCGLGSNEKIGDVVLNKSIVGTTYTLSVTSNKLNNAFSLIGYTWSTSASLDSINVMCNGDYYCVVSYTDSGVEKSVTLSYSVTDYDIEPPVISGVTPSVTERTNKDVILTPSITDNLSGVYGFSVNGGEYIQISSITVTNNGVYKFKAKDNFGNVTNTTVDFTVDIIDKEPPIVDSVDMSW